MARTADPHRREEILQAATQVFIEQGYSEARLADIAQKAGVVISTLYLYFDSKEAMVRAIAQKISMELMDQLMPVIEHLKEPADIARFIEIAATFATAHQDQIRIFHLDSGLSNMRLRNIGPGRRNAGTRGPRIQRGMHAFHQQAVEGYLHAYDSQFVIDMMIGFLRWFVTSYVLLEEEEADGFKTFCTQWLSNALLRPKDA